MKAFLCLILSILLAVPVTAQVGASQYPTSVDTRDTLFRVKDNARTTLSSGITSSTTTITVASTSTFDSTGSFVIDSEVIYYTGKTATQFTGVVRGRAGTSATSHAAGALVRGVILAEHHLVQSDAIITTQTKLGAGASTPTNNAVLIGTGAGASAWNAAPAINCSNCTGISGATGGVTNTGSTTIGADTDSSGGGDIDLQTRGVTRVKVNSAGSVSLFSDLTSSGGTINVPDKGGQVFNVKAYGALGDGAADDTAEIQAAITAAQTAGGGVVFFPAGNYVVSGAVSPLLSVTRAVILQGVGAFSSVIRPAASVGASIDVLGFVAPTTGFPTADADNEYFQMRDLGFIPVSGTPARHVLNLDVTTAGAYIARAQIERCHFGVFGGRAIVTTNPIPNTDGVFVLNISNNLIYNGIQLNQAGDTINVIGNTFRGESGSLSNPAIEAQLISGATTLNVSYNNITGGGGVWIKSGYKVIFDHNILEAYVAGSTGHNGAYVDLDCATARCTMPTVKDNVISSLSGVSLDGIRVNAADFATISDNTFNVPAGKVGIRVTASAVGTQIGRSRNDGVGALYANAGDASLTIASAAYETLPASGFDTGYLIPKGIRALSITYGYTEKTASFTFDELATTVEGNATGGAIVATLPVITAAMLGRIYELIKTDSSANAVTLTRGGTDTVNSLGAWGATTFALASQGKRVRVMAMTGGRWVVLNSN